MDKRAKERPSWNKCYPETIACRLLFSLRGVAAYAAKAAVEIVAVTAANKFYQTGNACSYSKQDTIGIADLRPMNNVFELLLIIIVMQPTAYLQSMTYRNYLTTRRKHGFFKKLYDVLSTKNGVIQRTVGRLQMLFTTDKLIAVIKYRPTCILPLLAESLVFGRRSIPEGMLFYVFTVGYYKNTQRLGLQRSSTFLIIDSRPWIG